jgi:hypothetical protein
VTPAATTEVLPAWWHAGHAIDMTTTELVDVEMLEHDEWDLEWRLCRVPVADLSPAFLDPDFVPLVHMPDESRGRFARIREWIGGRPVTEALDTAPILSILLEARDEENGLPRFHFLDGCHRTTVAMRDGAQHVPMVVGLGTFEATWDGG